MLNKALHFALEGWSCVLRNEVSGFGIAASVISRLVMKAIRSRKPRPRYVGGYLAKPLLLLRHW